MKFWESGQILNMFQKQAAKWKTNILYIDTNEIYIESQNFVDPRFSKPQVLGLNLRFKNTKKQKRKGKLNTSVSTRVSDIYITQDRVADGIYLGPCHLGYQVYLLSILKLWKGLDSGEHLLLMLLLT